MYVFHLYYKLNTQNTLLQQTELALQLCWAIGEHGGGGASHKDAARELFESLELLLYENLSSRYATNTLHHQHSKQFSNTQNTLSQIYILFKPPWCRRFGSWIK